MSKYTVSLTDTILVLHVIVNCKSVINVYLFTDRLQPVISNKSAAAPHCVSLENQQEAFTVMPL